MKVLIINQYCGFGSTGRIVQDLHDMLIENGHECCIAYGRNKVDSSDYNTYKIGGFLNNYVHVLETRLFDNHGFSSRIATKKFIKFIEDYNPDIIHIHNLHGYYVNIKILMEYLKTRETKIVWTFHDCWNFSRHSGYIDYQEGILPTEIISKDELREYPRSLFSPMDNYVRKKKIFSGFNNLVIVTPSFWLANMVKDTFFSEYPINVIHNGIDMEKFFPEIDTEILRKYGIADKEIILGVASVWDRRKGLKYLNKLDDLIDHTNKKIVVIGKIEERMKLSDDILHISQTDSIKEIRNWYSNAKVFINPTLYDNFPTTNIESFACGTPVITFDTGGSPESIINDAGKVVKKKDALSINEAIQDVNKLTEETIIFYRNKFDKNSKNIEYLKIYLGK
ncbi:glycosyltransferase [Enterococcus sp. DIV0170]|uniref:glycosyltransferase n=1 Tax=Enterococcus sp. DIV0170 TaxID=2774642 RepID=UPI003F25C3C9